jgi:hypothetical protein
MSYDKFNRKVLDNLTDEDKIIYTPLTRWRRRLDAPTNEMLGTMLWVLYNDGTYGMRAVGKAYYDDGHFDWTWVEDTCYDKDSDHEEWESVAYWTFCPEVILVPYY